MTTRDIIGAAFAGTRFQAIDVEGDAPSTAGERLIVPKGTLRELATEAFRNISFYLRRSHLGALADVLENPAASENDRFVVETLLRNALIAARGELPLCQDTGTATIIGWKDESMATGVDDEEELGDGAKIAYHRFNLRSSQVGASSFFDEYDTGDNRPSQIHIEATANGPLGPSYRLLFVAKGGGSANKTSLFQMTKALLEPKRFETFLREKVANLGVAACPPYRLAVVVGGTSPEENLRVLKLATTEVLDAAPPFASSGENAEEARERGWLRRDSFWENRLVEIARESGLGAQFGGNFLGLDARVLRLPRHAGSCPVSLGVSCSAHRNALAIIDGDGIRLESLEKDPAAFLRARGGKAAKLVDSFAASERRTSSARRKSEHGTEIPEIDLELPMAEIRSELSKRRVGDRLLLNGSLIVARDAAHLKWHELIADGKELPGYLADHPIYYAGPAATPPGKVIGSFGPTTAQRMDPYADELMSRGASLVTLAKGNRAPAWTEACNKYGGFYLGTIGGAAALIAEENIVESTIIDYPELGMEAVRLIRVKNLVAFIIADDKGNELYGRIASA